MCTTPPMLFLQPSTQPCSVVTMASPLNDEVLRRELRLLCDQGRLGPVTPSLEVVAVLLRHGLAEQLSETVWIPTPLGRSWCNIDESLGPAAGKKAAKSRPANHRNGTKSKSCQTEDLV